MPQIIEVPNYGQVEFPDGMSDQEIVAAIKKTSMGYGQPVAQAAESAKDSSMLGNLAAGAARGAASIGSTIAAPFVAAIEGTGQTGAQSKRGKMLRATEEALKYFGADTDSTAYGIGKLGSEIAGTAGVPGVLAKGAHALNAAPKIMSALGSGGMALNSPVATTLKGKAADLALRVGAGGAAGGSAAAMVDPESAGIGTMIGAAAYPAIKSAAMIGKAGKDLAGSVVTNSLGVLTGAGSEAIKEAFRAGGRKSTAFLDNLTGKVDMTDVLDDAKTALGKMREARAAEYRTGMANVTKDRSVLDMTPVLNAVKQVQQVGSFKGQAVNKNAAGTVQEMSDKVAEWAQLNPAEYHTPEGLDALKRAIGDIRDATQFGTPARKAADQIYNSVKRQITDQAPEYAKTMRAYSEASDAITEIQKALSLGEKTSADTAMRKLQSLMRNNVNTNYGNRLSLAKMLEEQGGADLMPAIAGQALNSWAPRGLMAPVGMGAGAMAGLTNPAVLAGLPLGSPRLMANMAYGAGRATQGASNALGGLLGAPQLMPLLPTAGAVSLSR